MPYRHWFVVVTSEGVEHRSGPYVSRRSAERKAREHHKHAPTGTLEVVYDPAPLGPNPPPGWRPR
jgi:hypothetical protein